MPVDVGAIGADFYVWTAHKAYGPTGLGVLHGRREVLEAMPPFLSGGRHDQLGRLPRDALERAAWKFEAGTSPIAEGAALGAAVEFLQGIGMEHVRAHEQGLTAYALDRLQAVEGLRVLGPRDAEARGALVAFTLDGVHPHDVAEILARDGVCVRAGHHCAQPLMRALGITASTRASFAIHNTTEDVDRLVAGLAQGAGGLRARWTTSTARRSSSTTSAPTTGARWSGPDLEFEDSNPLCGDELRVMLRVGDDGTVEDVRFAGHGCAISQAAASMASDEVVGMRSTTCCGSTARSSWTSWASTSPPRA